MTASVARFIESFIPENYNLFLDINRSEKTFTGNVAITGEAIDNHISLHQKDLTINSVLLDNESLNFQMDDANEAFHIELPEWITGSLGLAFIILAIGSSVIEARHAKNTKNLQSS